MNAMLATNDVGLHPVGYVSIGYTQVGIGSGTSATLYWEFHTASEA